MNVQPTHYQRPLGLLAGFYTHLPEKDVPELVHMGEQWVASAHYIGDHAHEVWEFYLQVSGESRWEAPLDTKPHAGDVTYVVKPGDFFAVGPNVRHRMAEHPAAKHHFYFAAVNLREILLRHPELQDVWSNRSVVFCEHSESLVSPFRQLVREVSLELPQRATGIRLALDYLVVGAARLLETTNSQANSPVLSMLGHPGVALAKELLDSQPHRDWTLRELARATGLSPNHLAESFTHEIGVPPHRYLLQRRIERAQELLRLSDIAITDIAMELGFSSSQHFATIFRKMTGITASQFRAQSRL